MVCSLSSSCATTTSRLIYASLQPKNNNTDSVPPIHSQNNGKPGKMLRIRNKPQTTPKQQPSVAEMERAIGAGMFRDRDPRGSGEKQTLFDFLSSTPINQPESPLEKKLRETGEWVLDATEGPTPSGGHEILMVVCLRILPVWLLFLLVASGTVKLPFNIPALDDLIM